MSNRKTRTKGRPAPVARPCEVCGEHHQGDDVLGEKHRAYLAVVEADRAIRQAQAQLHHAVEQARWHGNSWQDVGDALDISRQAAQQRFGAPAGSSSP